MQDEDRLNDMPEEDEGDDDPESLEDPPGEGRPARGLAWLFLPALLGIAIGGALGTLRGAGSSVHDLNEVAGMLRGGTVGGLVGLGVGTFIWVFFPYKGPKNSSPKE
jgi:hypothetical protein